MAGLRLSALVMRSSEIFTAVKIAGALYLVAFWARTLWRARSPRRAAVSGSRPLPWNGHNDYVQGFLGNVLNPKAAAAR